MKNIFTTKRAVVTITILGVIGMFGVISRRGSEASKSTSEPQNLLSQNPETPALGQGQSVVTVAPAIKKYTHSLIGFSFTYPASFSISSFSSVYNEEGETILLQSKDGQKGLQVLVVPFDEDVVLTEARIQRDISDLAISEVSTRTLGSKGNTAQTVIFTSTNSFMGKSREAWFVREKRLYQVSAPVEAQELFNNIVTSWEF